MDRVCVHACAYVRVRACHTHRASNSSTLRWLVDLAGASDRLSYVSMECIRLLNAVKLAVALIVIISFFDDLCISTLNND